ncbi:hypothetical protein Spla01_05475 [Streptomyces platensis]|uniref:Uncharacterized protein n=1 Tax=Streptomyces platensis TaxID=58346 RepID=A0ABX3XLD9_STRPT|nr:hypothetical protein BG653_06936 [Streptomyces platensis]
MAYERSVPYRAGTEGYTSFRIPAVVRACSGDLFAFAEGRVSSAADSGRRPGSPDPPSRAAHCPSATAAGCCSPGRRTRRPAP